MQGSQGQLHKEEELRYRMHQGRPHLFTDMRITNDEGHEMPQDGKATGELEVRGPHVVKAYFRVIPLPMLYHDVYTACMQPEVPWLKDRLMPTPHALSDCIYNKLKWVIIHKIGIQKKEKIPTFYVAFAAQGEQCSGCRGLVQDRGCGRH